MKILLNIVGSIALALAVLGIFLPLLPTTPFLLLASACYVRGSERLHRKLRENRVFGEYLRNYEDKRAIPRRARIVALVMLWSSLLYSAWRVEPLVLKLLLLTLGVAVTFFLLRLKTLEVDSGR